MSVYVVSWGVARGDDYVEWDSIVHTSLEAAREEFEAANPAESVSGPAAASAFEQGWTTRCTLTRVEMLDEQNNPTNDIGAWMYEGEREQLDQK